VRRVRCKLGTQSVAIKKEHKGSAQEEGARIATNKTRWGKKNHTTKKCEYEETWAAEKRICRIITKKIVSDAGGK